MWARWAASTFLSTEINWQIVIHFLAQKYLELSKQKVQGVKLYSWQIGWIVSFFSNNSCWNSSFYDALKSANKDLMLLKTDEFQEIFEHFGVLYLSSSEEDLI